jgi:hypothetical protein
MYYSNILAAWTPMVPSIQFYSYLANGTDTSVTINVPNVNSTGSINPITGYNHVRFKWSLNSPIAGSGGANAPNIFITFNNDTASGTAVNYSYPGSGQQVSGGISFTLANYGTAYANAGGGELLIMNNNITTGDKLRHIQGILGDSGKCWPFTGWYRASSGISSIVSTVTFKWDTNAQFVAGGFIHAYWEI